MAPSQLIIHRDEDMMYYIYVRKLYKTKYIGFAIAINGYYFTQIEPLFSLFENKIEELVETGIIINLTDNGKITTNLPSFKNEEEEVMSTFSSLQSRVNNLENLKKLPPVDFSVSITSRKLFKQTSSTSEIVEASYRFGYTTILKESDYDTVRTTSFKNILRNQSADKNALLKEIQQLKAQNKKIQQQKKQFKNVILLIIIVIICGIGLYFLNENLNDTQDQLETANNTISEKEHIISSKDSHISNLRDSVTTLELDLRREVYAKKQVEQSIKKICSYTPFAITSCDVNANYFKFDYFIPEEREITVTLKAINDKTSEIVSNTHILTFYKGSGSKSLNFSRRLDSSQYYYVVLIYNGHIVAGKRW